MDLKAALAKRSMGIGDHEFRVSIERIKNRTALSNRVGEDISFRRTEEAIEVPTILRILGEELSVPLEESRRHRKELYNRAVAARYPMSLS